MNWLIIKFQMAILASDILDHPCDTDDDKMETMYQTHFMKKGKGIILSWKIIRTCTILFQVHLLPNIENSQQQ